MLVFEFGQFTQDRLVLRGEFFGHLDVDLHEQVALTAVAGVGHSPAPKPEDFSTWSPGRDLQFVAPVEGGDLQCSSEGSLGVADRNLANEIIAITMEQGMLRDLDEAIAIARRSAILAAFSFPLQSKASAVVHSRRNTDFPFDPLWHDAIASAVEAGIANDRPSALT